MRKFKMLVAMVVALSLVLSIAPHAFAAGGYVFKWVENPDVVFTWVYTRTNSLGFTLIDESEGRYKRGFFTPDGSVVKPSSRFGCLTEDGRIFYDNYVVDKNGKTIIPEGKYVGIAYLNENMLFCAVDPVGKGEFDDYRWAITDSKGNPLTEFIYSGYDWSMWGVFVVFVENETYDTHVFDEKGNKVYSAEDGYIEPLGRNDRFIHSGKLYDLEGNVLFESEGSNGYVRWIDDKFVIVREDDYDIVFNMDGEIIAEGDYVDVLLSNHDFLVVNIDGEVIAYDYDGDEFDSNVNWDNVDGWYSSENIFVTSVYEDGKSIVGAVDIDGNEVIPSGKFSEIKMITDDLYIGYKENGTKSLRSISTGQKFIELGTDEATIIDACDGTFFVLEYGEYGNYSYKFFTLKKDEISVTINGKAVEFDQAPVIKDGRTLVPLRAIFEALGASVEWNNETRTVKSELGSVKVKVTVDSKEMYVNGEKIKLDVPAQIVNNRTLVPARAVSEAFGCEVNWNNNTRTVVIEK